MSYQKVKKSRDHAGCIASLFLLLCLWPSASADEAQEKPATPEERCKALMMEFNRAARGLWESKTEEERAKVAADGFKIPPQFLELAEKDPASTTARAALVHAVTTEIWLENNTSHPGWGRDSPQDRALAMLLRHHLESDQLGEACTRVSYGFRKAGETFLRAVLEKSPHREVQALACLRLAQFLNRRQQRLVLIQERPEMAARYQGLFGSEYLEELKRLDRTRADQEIISMFERAADRYGDVNLAWEGTVRERSRSELYEIRRLSVGKEALDIDGEDQDGKRFKLSDYRGKVVLLYFWSEY
jgi:hypothetical protein